MRVGLNDINNTLIDVSKICGLWEDETSICIMTLGGMIKLRYSEFFADTTQTKINEDKMKKDLRNLRKLLGYAPIDRVVKEGR